jgi:hypothetical protein
LFSYKAAYKPEQGSFYILDSAKTTAKLLENQSNLVCMDKLMQRLDEMLRQDNPSAGIYQMRCMKKK